MHKAKQIVNRLLEADGEGPDHAGDIKQLVARRQSGSKNMESRFSVQSRARVIAGRLLELDINPS